MLSFRPDVVLSYKGIEVCDYLIKTELPDDNVYTAEEIAQAWVVDDVDPVPYNYDADQVYHDYIRQKLLNRHARMLRKLE